MKELNWIALALLGASTAYAGGGRIGSGSDGLIYEEGKTPSDAVATVGEFGSLEVRGAEEGIISNVSIYRCAELDKDGTPKSGSCKFVAETEVNRKTALIPSDYLVQYFGVFYPTTVPVKKDTNTVIRLQKIAFAENSGGETYIVSKDMSSPEMLASLRMGYFGASFSLDYMRKYCGSSKISDSRFDEICDAIQTSNKALILEKLFPLTIDQGYETIGQLRLYEHQGCAGIPFTHLCGPTVTKYDLSIDTFMRGLQPYATAMKLGARFVSVLPGVYKVSVQGQTYKGIVVPMPK
jgi:hypothetical protein